MRELDNVQETLPIIHLAGTNGKGSVGAYLASIFCAAGLSVARYTSPAVFDPLEVFTYNGENITESEYVKVMSQVKDAGDIMVSAGKECPTIFEIAPEITFIIIDRLFGGSGDTGGKVNRDLTDIEQSVMEGIIVRILANMREAWTQVIDLRPRLQQIETNPQFAQIVPPSEMVILVTLEIKIGEEAA